MDHRDPRSALHTWARILFLALVSAFAASPAHASIVDEGFDLDGAAYHDLTGSEFAQRFREMRRGGMLPVDIDAHRSGSALKYSVVWRKNSDGRRWAMYRDMTSEQYAARWRSLRSQGFRPVDVETYASGSGRLWAGIWVQNREDLRWASYRDMSEETFVSRFNAQRSRGFRPIDIEIYRSSGGLRYASIWVRNADDLRWAQFREMSETAFRRRHTEQARAGFRLADLEVYNSRGTRYAAIWVRPKSTTKFALVDGVSSQDFSNHLRTQKDIGYRLIDIERYVTTEGPRYAGIWVANRSRLTNKYKEFIDREVKRYRQRQDLPGISVAVVHKGDVIYRRGFGWADQRRRKVAHSGTVYSAASVSKAIGGTLAAKLEAEQRLRNGRTFSLDMTLPTMTYLQDTWTSAGSSSLPDHHTHRVEHLFSQLSCVRHYPNRVRAGIDNLSGHYRMASDAVVKLWDYPLLGVIDEEGNECSVGSDYVYSTHAYTFGAAVLEQATGTPINRLLGEELFEPYGLDSMRVQFASRRLSRDPQRAIPYDNGNKPVSYPDTSWKVFGGGIETNAVDLAVFGWKVLDGQIVSTTTRDNRLWRPVSPGNTNFGIGWAIRRDGRRSRIAEWNGQQTGARSFLRVYRDAELVIAVLSNRGGQDRDCFEGRENRNCGITALVERIGTYIVHPGSGTIQ